MRDGAVKISVIIVNYNAGARLARTYAALAAQTFRDFETILYDNASADGSAATPAPEGLAVRVVQDTENRGFALANNIAAKSANGEWLAFLNPDAYPEPQWLAELIAASARHPGVEAFGSAQIDAADPSRLDGAGDAYHVFGAPYRGHFGWPLETLPAEGETFAPCAAAALWRADAFARLGGFDARFFCYGEDVDLGFRHRLAGGRCVQVAAARVLHEGSGVSGRRSAFTTYHGHRNRVWTFVKNMPGLIFWPMLPLHVLLNLYLFARLALIGLGGPYARAMRDAAAGLPEFIAERGRVQRARVVPLGALARQLTWSPLALARRAAKIVRP